MNRLALVMVVLVSWACTEAAPDDVAREPRGARPAPSVAASPTPVPSEEPAAADEPLNRWVTRRPPWLGTRPLPLGPEGLGARRPTPPLLRNRRLATIDLLPPPKRDLFRATITPVPPDILDRSTWRPKCPVSPGDLAYVKMTFWGFDRLTHRGEMIVNASVAEEIVGVFHKLYEAKFPIEEMRIISREEQKRQDRAPTGDGNVTGSFSCRPATLGTRWSEHAYGLAVDINPFHNPYLRGDLLAPELAGAYADRTWRRPGMIVEGEVVTRAFDAIGWSWGGRWSSLKDWMHFSRSGH